MLDDRKSRILQVLVEEYIRTGEPVGSASICELSKLAVSSATVRNELARLEDLGLISQPHTSAGRVPTQTGYRWFVDHCAPARLRSATRTRIHDFFTSMHGELSRLLKETTQLLADITHYPAVVLGPGLGSETVHGLHLVTLGSGVVLVVVVTDAGRVTQEVCRVAARVTPDDIAAAEELLGRALVGRDVSSGVAALPEEAADASRPVARILGAAAEALHRVESGTRELYLGGTSQLAALWHDLANVQQVLMLLEREHAVLEMMSSAGGGTSVRLGPDLNVGDVDLALVSTDYDAGEHGAGRVGVLGPMRMDYRRTIKIVEEVGDGLGDSIGG